MSTKSSIVYSGYPKPEGIAEVHFFEDLVDPQESGVYLELRGEGIEYDASPGTIRVRIPADVWEVIRQHQHVSFDVEHATDDALYVRAVKDEADFAELFPKSTAPWTAAEMETRVADRLEFWKKRRAHQRDVRAKMAKYQMVRREE